MRCRASCRLGVEALDSAHPCLAHSREQHFFPDRARIIDSGRCSECLQHPAPISHRRFEIGKCDHIPVDSATMTTGLSADRGTRPATTELGALYPVRLSCGCKKWIDALDPPDAGQDRSFSPGERPAKNGDSRGRLPGSGGRDCGRSLRGRDNLAIPGSSERL